MRALLIHRDRDLDLRELPPPHEKSLVQDLQLETLLAAMAGGDMLVLGVSRRVLLSSLQGDVDTIQYRQEILRDCLAHPDVVRAIYDLAGEAIEEAKNVWNHGIFGRFAESVLRSAIGVLEILTGLLLRLRTVAEENAGRFRSKGFATLFAMLRAELSDEYLAELRGHLEQLKFRGGIPVSARLGESNEGTDYVLHIRRGRRWEWLDRLLGDGGPALTVRIPERDDAGARALFELRERSVHVVASALAQASDHVSGFFEMLRAEVAFWIGALNLHARLKELGLPLTFPEPAAACLHVLRVSGLCDVCLALGMGRGVVPNDLEPEGRGLCVITGANQGGKTSFLRGVGVAQIMMQAGLFVGAESLLADVCTGVFTHFRREEDASMKSGKLDEELGRMSALVDAVSPNALVLFNESFAATNEREGSEIARQVVSALRESRIKVFFVTHLYEFAHGLAERGSEDAVFLRAERRADGTRTFKLVRGAPLETSYGEDVYREVFADDESRPREGPGTPATQVPHEASDTPAELRR